MIKKSGRSVEKEMGWALGFGIERLAMLVNRIPDIRLFWSEDERFMRQFEEGKFCQFKPFSKYEVCYKDVSFWVPPKLEFDENDIMEIVREFAGDLVEEVKCIDTFFNKKTEQTSKCYRINYRSLERVLENAEIDHLQFQIRDALVEKLGVTLR